MTNHAALDGVALRNRRLEHGRPGQLAPLQESFQQNRIPQQKVELCELGQPVETLVSVGEGVKQNEEPSSMVVRRLRRSHAASMSNLGDHQIWHLSVRS